jgi:hypothetical protein
VFDFWVRDPLAVFVYLPFTWSSLAASPSTPCIPIALFWVFELAVRVRG